MKISPKKHLPGTFIICILLSLPIVLLLQLQSQVRIQGMVLDTSGHIVENANVNIWKAADHNTFEAAETDFNGEYNIDVATPVAVENYNIKPLTVLNNGTHNHIGFSGTVPESPQNINIINSIGQRIANIPSFQGKNITISKEVIC